MFLQSKKRKIRVLEHWPAVGLRRR